jgi:hypothetical protein
MPDLRDLSDEQLDALVADPVIRNFNRDMQEAEASIGIYLELRRRRGVVDSTVLEAEHQDIIGVTKSALVASLSALDSLVHAVLRQHLPPDQFEKVRYKTFQSSKQLASALGRLGLAPDFSEICRRMSSDLYRPADVATLLDEYYDRKSYITHHADTDASGIKIRFVPAYALSCVRFIRDFGHAFHLTTFRV